MLHGVAVCDGKVLLDPGVEFGHVADLGIIVEDDVGLLLRQKRIVLFKTRVAVGARDDGRLGDGQRAVCHQKAEAVLLTDGLEHALARIGGEGFIQAFLHVGGLGVGPGPGGGAAGDPFGLDGRDRLTVPAGLQHKAELRHGTGQQEYKFEIGKGIVLKEGKDVTIFATGLCVNETVEAEKMLAKDGIDAEIINIHTIKPIDRELVVKSALKTGKVVTVEEHSVIGGLGSAVCDVLCEEAPTKVLKIGVNDVFGESGPALELLHKYELDAEGIYKKVKAFVK